MVELLGNHYGKRAFQAVDAVRRGMVKRYNDFWVVEGKSDKYIVEIDGDDGFCLCKDWLIRRSAKGDICYHMLAARIADQTGMFIRVDEWCIDTVLKDY
jgi:predicted nucleic acid-binding Zn finger protein